MYDDLVPLVKQHLASGGPLATFSLSGHSLGGSLASVLMLLLVYRKVATPAQLSPSYTFGAPAVFCAGGSDASSPAHHPPLSGAADVGEHHAAAHRCDSCMLNCDMHGIAPELRDPPRPQSSSAAAACNHHRRPVMQQLGIPDEMLINVMMHKDIVPRAFVCGKEWKHVDRSFSCPQSDLCS